MDREISLNGVNDSSDSESLSFSGSQVNYYFVCKRKLYLFSHHIELENESDLVLLGKLLHENSYKRKLKEIELRRVKIDFIEKSREVNEIHEIKRSRKIEKAHIFQLLYYLYVLKKTVAISPMIGIIDYPLIKKKVKVDLTPEYERNLESVLQEIKYIVAQQKPPEPEWKPYCRKCAYAELCWS